MNVLTEKKRSNQAKTKRSYSDISTSDWEFQKSKEGIIEREENITFKKLKKK